MAAEAAQTGEAKTMIEKRDVLEIFAEASRAPRSVFAEMPQDGVGIEFSKRRKGEDPLVVRMRARKYRLDHLEEMRAKDRRIHHNDPALQARKATRAEYLATATCKTCERPLNETHEGHMGPRPDFCGFDCARSAREKKSMAKRQQSRAVSSAELHCQHCGKKIEHIGKRGRLPKSCTECRELSRNRQLARREDS